MAEENKKDLVNESRNELVKDVVEFIKEFEKESDRAIVILGAAKIDSLLSQLLTKYLLANVGSTDELFDGDSPLSTFSSRINLSYRLGLIDDTLTRALHLVRRIRNAFAHEVTGCSLESGPQKDRIKQLVDPVKKYKLFSSLKENHFKDKAGLRADYFGALALITARIHWAILHTDTLNCRKKTTYVPQVYIDDEMKNGSA